VLAVHQKGEVKEKIDEMMHVIKRIFWPLKVSWKLCVWKWEC